MNLWMRLCYFNLIFKVHWAVTFYLKLLLVRLAEAAALAHVDILREELVLFGVDHGEGVDGNEDLVSVAVNPDRVVVVLVFIQGWGELNVNLFGDSGGYHAFLIVPDFEVVGLGWQNVEPLRLRRVVYQAQFHCVRLVGFETCELDHAWRSAEDAVGAYRIVDMFVGDGVALVGFSFGEQPSLQFNLVLAVGWQVVRVSSASVVVTLRSSS